MAGMVERVWKDSNRREGGGSALAADELHASSKGWNHKFRTSLQ